MSRMNQGQKIYWFKEITTTNTPQMKYGAYLCQDHQGQHEPPQPDQWLSLLQSRESGQQFQNKQGYQLLMIIPIASTVMFSKVYDYLVNSTNHYFHNLSWMHQSMECNPLLANGTIMVSALRTVGKETFASHKEVREIQKALELCLNVLHRNLCNTCMKTSQTMDCE